MVGKWVSALPRAFLLLCVVSVSVVLIQLLSIAVSGATKFYGGDEEVDLKPHLVMSHEAMVAEVERTVPSLPLAYVLASRGRGLGLNASCGPFPDPLDLQLTNTHWQTTSLGCATAQLFGAYFDNRTGEAVVRLLGMIDRRPFGVQGHCQMWFGDGGGPPAVVPMSAIEDLWKWQWLRNGVYHPYLMTCRVPQERVGRPPAMVSLVNSPCDKATNVLKVHYDRSTEKKDFAVCVKGQQMLDGNFAIRLIEWLELVRILGADKVIMYRLHVHPTIDRVLGYYEKAGLVSVSNVTSAGRHINHPLLQDLFVDRYRFEAPVDELIHYNDCLYRNLNSYRYISPMDVDEVIVPTHNETWRDLVDLVQPKATVAFKGTPDSFCAANTYFFDQFAGSGERFHSLPHGAHMLRHVRRSRLFSPTKFFPKCFHDVGRMLASHNHYPLVCLWPPCHDYNMDHDDGRMQHYRKECQEGTPTSCDDYRNDTVEDTTLWRYRDRLVSRLTTALREIGLSDAVV